MDNKKHENGKGDKSRPLSIPKKEFDDKWDKIFNNEKEKEWEIRLK